MMKKCEITDKQRNIIIVIGKLDKNEDYGFYEFIVAADTNSINYKSFQNDSRTQFIILRLYDAACTQSYLIHDQNRTYIVF